jgi:hypothetical protein
VPQPEDQTIWCGHCTPPQAIARGDMPLHLLTEHDGGTLPEADRDNVPTPRRPSPPSPPSPPPPFSFFDASHARPAGPPDLNVPPLSANFPRDARLTRRPSAHGRLAATSATELVARLTHAELLAGPRLTRDLQLPPLATSPPWDKADANLKLQVRLSAATDLLASALDTLSELLGGQPTDLPGLPASITCHVCDPPRPVTLELIGLHLVEIHSTPAEDLPSPSSPTEDLSQPTQPPAPPAVQIPDFALHPEEHMTVGDLLEELEAHPRSSPAAVSLRLADGRTTTAPVTGTSVAFQPPTYPPPPATLRGWTTILAVEDAP